MNRRTSEFDCTFTLLKAFPLPDQDRDSRAGFFNRRRNQFGDWIFPKEETPPWPRSLKLVALAGWLIGFTLTMLAQFFW